MIKADTTGADVLAEKLKGLPQKLQIKISRVILKEALKETGAREELTGYIGTHFKARTGIYRKSVSGIKSARVRSDQNRIISYIHKAKKLTFRQRLSITGLMPVPVTTPLAKAQVLKEIRSSVRLLKTSIRWPSTEQDSISPPRKLRNSRSGIRP